MRRTLALFTLFVMSPYCWSTPPDATAYQITVAHSGATTSGGTLALQLTPRWTATLPAASGYPLIVGTSVYAIAGGLLYAFDAQTGATLWGPTQTPSAVGATYDGGSIFVVNGSGLLSSFNATTGTPGWSVQLPGQYSFSSPPTASSGIVYAGGAGSGGTLYAVNETNGAVLWTASVENGDNSSPAIGPNAVYVSYACLNTYAFNLTTGAQIWSNPLATCEGGGGETAVYANGKLYARDDVSGDDIFDGTTGTILGAFSSAPPPAVDTTTAYYLSGSGTLTAVDLASSSVRWSFAGDGGLTSAPVVVDRTVIVGSASGNLYGLDEQSGAVTWQVNSGQAISSGAEWFNTPYGLAIADGLLVVPAGTQLLAYSIFGPPAPTGAAATSAVGAVQLTWTGASGATTYNIYVTTTSGSESFAPVLTGVNGTNATVPNLTPGTPYYFTIKAIGPGGISAASNEVSATPVAPLPAANLAATAGTGSVALSWSASANAPTYNVYVGTSPGGEATTAILGSITTNSASVGGLTPGTSYYFIVKATANGATSIASNEAVAVPLTTAPPQTFAATPQIGGADFSWLASPGATSYQLFIGTAAGHESATPSATGLTGTASTISGLDAGTTYYAILRSVVAGVAGGPSNEVSFTALSEPAPQSLVFTPGVGDITLSWAATPTATSYSIFEGTTAGHEAATPAQIVTGLQAQITGLTTGTTYYFYVEATTPIGPSSPSAEGSADPDAPPGPTNLAATAGVTDITLTWSAAAGATSYEVFEGTTAGGESTTAVQTNITGLSTVVSGLSGGTKYYYIVRAETPDGTSATSNEASASAEAPASTSSGGGGGGTIDWEYVAALGLLVAGRFIPQGRRSA